MEKPENTLKRYHNMLEAMKAKGYINELFFHIRKKGIALKKELEKLTYLSRGGL